MKDIRARLERMGLGGGDGRFLAASIAVCLIALLAYGALVHLPLRAEQAAYEKKAVELRTRLAAVMNFKNVHGDLAAYEKELSDREGRAERMLPRELGQGVFLQDLQHKALQSQVKLQKVAPAEARSVDGVQEMPVAIACSGSYFSVLDFLRRLQQSERLLSVHETRIEQQVQGKDGMLQCQLVVTAYAWSQDEAKSGADDEAAEERGTSLE